MKLRSARQTRFGLAVKDFTAALKLNPGNPETYANRGLTLMILGKEREALSDLQKCVELNPELKTTLETH